MAKLEVEILKKFTLDLDCKVSVAITFLGLQSHRLYRNLFIKVFDLGSLNAFNFPIRVCLVMPL